MDPFLSISVKEQQIPQNATMMLFTFILICVFMYEGYHSVHSGVHYSLNVMYQQAFLDFKLECKLESAFGPKPDEKLRDNADKHLHVSLPEVKTLDVGFLINPPLLPSWVMICDAGQQPRKDPLPGRVYGPKAHKNKKKTKRSQSNSEVRHFSFLHWVFLAQTIRIKAFQWKKSSLEVTLSGRPPPPPSPPPIPKRLFFSQLWKCC